MKPLIALLALAPLAACTTEAPPEVDDQGVLELGIRNAVLVEPGVISSGQPTEEQLAALPGLGYRAVIQLRPADEENTGWEEAAASELGLSFLRIPVSGSEGINEANARALDEALRGVGRSGTLVACASGNRVGGLFALRAHFCGGVAPEQALEQGRKAGLTRGEPAVRRALGMPEGQ